MRVQGLFPTPVSFFTLDRNLTKEENNFFLNQETYRNSGNTTSNHRNVLDEVVSKDLRVFIEESIKEYFEFIVKPQYEVKPYITQSWLNYTKEGEFHHSHQHPNSYISGVFYVQADREKDKIHFSRSRYSQIKVMSSKYDEWNSESWWFDVGTGDLLIFPSYLTHAVESVKGSTRISLSFNTFLKGYIGEDTELTGLHL